jgi:ADP-heptose:LPS heptosyltransferase
MYVFHIIQADVFFTRVGEMHTPLISCKSSAAYPNRIAVIRYGHLGDILQITPFLDRLRRKYPRAHIVFFTGDAGREVLRRNPAVDEVVPCPAVHFHPAGLRALITTCLRARSAGWDRAYVLTPYWRYHLLARLMGARACIGFHGRRVSPFLTGGVEWRGEEGEHFQRRYLALLGKVKGNGKGNRNENGNEKWNDKRNDRRHRKERRERKEKDNKAEKINWNEQVGLQERDGEELNPGKRDGEGDGGYGGDEGEHRERDESPTVFAVPGETRDRVNVFLEEMMGESAARDDAHLVAIHPGGGGARWADRDARRWPPERFRELIRCLLREGGLIPVIVGGSEEVEYSQKLLDRLTSKERVQVVNMTGKCTLEELGACLMHAALFVGNDSGPLHLAAAVGTPTIGIYGPQNPAVHRPLRDDHIPLWNPPSCAPCYDPDISPRCVDPPPCMMNISADDVLQAVKKLLMDGRVTERVPSLREMVR